MEANSRYDPAWTASYFDELGDREWGRLQEDPVAEVSLHLHTTLIDEKVPEGSFVLEVGAGPGRFTQVLATRGCSVVVTDISSVQLDLHRRFADEMGFEEAVRDRLRLDVCDMAAFEDETFDAVLCYGGPLSYVLDGAERALRECRRVVRRGRPILASVGSLWGSCHSRLRSVLQVPPAANRWITGSGDLLPSNWEGVQHRCHLFRAKELRELIACCGLELEVLSASHALATGWSQELREVRDDREAWTELLRMEEEACREPGCLDMGEHIIFAARRPGAPRR